MRRPMDVDMEREQLRRAAHGPCKQACLLFGEMAFTIHKAQVRQRIDSARDKASAQFYSDARLQRLGEQQRRRAVASFEQQLEHTRECCCRLGGCLAGWVAGPSSEAVAARRMTDIAYL
eukprot:COSAG01_NODE_12988_length_1652_cov_2.701867_2_plen_119_part_00